MNSKQALEYLYMATVIEPTVADEQAEKAVTVLRRRLKTLEYLIDQMFEGMDVREAKFWLTEANRSGLPQ